jgi:hypothetical protein
MNGASQNASVLNMGLSGSWGEVSQPRFTSVAPVIAVDTGGQPGLGSGDGLLLRFNQPVAQVPVGSKAALDALLYFYPPNWAAEYTGQWLDTTTLFVTGTSVLASSAADPMFRAATAVGTMSITVLPSGGLTSLDGSSPPCDASTLVASGSFGDVVCDAGVHVFSGTTLLAAFQPPVNASYVPDRYMLQVSQDATFPGPEALVSVSVLQSRSDVMVPGGASPATLRFLLQGLTRDTLYVRSRFCGV